jgi:hypothetical protein
MANQFLCKHYRVFPSQVKKYLGKDTYEIFGETPNEFGELTQCHVFTGEYYDNWPNWEPLINEMKNNRGRYYLMTGKLRFKNRNQGLINADSVLRIEDSIEKKDWTRKEKVEKEVESVKEFEHDLFIVE